MKLCLCRFGYYRVKRGQTVASIAAAFSLPPRVLAAENALTEEVRAGQVLFVPEIRRNLYTVRGGESRSLLCGSKENFEALNRTRRLYPAQTVFL